VTLQSGRGGESKQNLLFEGSQAVSVSPSGRGEAFIGDLFNFKF
jgi:hypothetical protein